MSAANVMKLIEETGAKFVDFRFTDTHGKEQHVTMPVSQLKEDTFEEGLLEYPHYTRPRIFRGEEVPEVLLSGNHEKIKAWRKIESLKRTKERRPDLLEKAELSEQDREILAGLEVE